VREHIELFSSYYPNARPVADTITAAGLQGLERRPFDELSGGQKQRLMFALAICGRPDLLFLDEPTAGLDPDARRGLWRQVRGVVAEGAAVLLTTHYIEEAEALASRVLLLRRGVVVANGTPAELKSLASAGTLEDAFLALTKDEHKEVPA
jgi:ABC-2 type transport system ATP-binding protein